MKPYTRKMEEEQLYGNVLYMSSGFLTKQQIENY